MDGHHAVSPSKRMSDPLTEQEIFLNNLNLIAVRRVRVKYSRTIKERLRATTKEESLALPSAAAVARGKLASSPVRRKPDVSPGRAGSPSPRQRLDVGVTPGPSGINIQGGINVLQSIKRRKKIKNVTPPSTKSLLSYLHRKSSEEFENASSSTEGEEEETFENSPSEDPNLEPFRLREVSIQMSRVRWNEGDVLHNTPNSRKSSLILTSPIAAEAPQPPMNGWARIDADHYDRNEQLKNLISDLEAEILEREMEYAKKKLSLGEKSESPRMEPLPPPQSTQTLQSDLEIRERILRDLNLRPELDISEESRIDPEELREIEEDTTISLQLPAIHTQVNKTPDTAQPEVDNLEASSAMPVGLLTTVQTHMKPLSINQHEDNRPSVANQSIANSSFDSVLSTITESSIKSEIKEEPQSYANYETAVSESIEEEYEEVPNAGPAEVKQEYLQSFSIIPTQHFEDMDEIEVKYSESEDLLKKKLSCDIPAMDRQSTQATSQIKSAQQSEIQSSPRTSTRQQDLLSPPGTSRQPIQSGESPKRIGIREQDGGEKNNTAEEPDKTSGQKSKDSLLDHLSQSADSDDDHQIVRRYTSKMKNKRKDSFLQKQLEMLNKIQNQNKQTSEIPAIQFK